MLYKDNIARNKVYLLLILVFFSLPFVQAFDDDNSIGDFEAIAIASSGDNFSPCGSCRQVINEFGEDIDLIFEWDGEVVVESLKGILPYNFVLEK